VASHLSRNIPVPPQHYPHISHLSVQDSIQIHTLSNRPWYSQQQDIYHTTRGEIAVKLSLLSTSTRTFLAIPAIVMTEQVIRRQPVQPLWLLPMVWGFLQYYLVGRYRNRYRGGGPGLKKAPHNHLLSTGPYAATICNAH